MTKLSKKIFSGENANDEDWTEYLKEAHSKIQGMTEKAFADHKTELGCNTYELIANEIKTSDKKILDMACGDGYLSKYSKKLIASDAKYIGVDMVQTEIDYAIKNNTHDKRFEYLNSMAQSLPFCDNEFDLILCHLALMLMLPLDEVITEISRTLRPNGRFIGLIGRSTDKGGMFEIMGEEVFAFIKKTLANAASFRTGDERLNDQNQIRELFLKKNIKVKTFKELWLNIIGTPKEIWQSLENFYVINLLPEEEKRTFKSMLISDLERKYIDGEITLRLPLLMFEAFKLS